MLDVTHLVSQSRVMEYDEVCFMHLTNKVVHNSGCGCFEFLSPLLYRPEVTVSRGEYLELGYILVTILLSSYLHYHNAF